MRVRSPAVAVYVKRPGLLIQSRLNNIESADIRSYEPYAYEPIHRTDLTKTKVSLLPV